jgi:hypothetical protein
MPYAVDLVRLVTSAIIAKQENGLTIDASGAATAVLEGYRESLEAGGKPFILEESHPDLREMALGAEREPIHFWSKLTNLPRLTPPKRLQRLLQRSLPDNAEEIAFSHRIAGVGSLGRPRYVATAQCNGVWSRAKRKRGCPRLGAGPVDGRRSAPFRLGCSNAQFGSRIHTMPSRTGGSFVDWGRTVEESNWRSSPRNATNGSSCGTWGARRLICIWRHLISARTCCAI